MMMTLTGLYMEDRVTLRVDEERVGGEWIYFVEKHWLVVGGGMFITWCVKGRIGGGCEKCV